VSLALAWSGGKESALALHALRSVDPCGENGEFHTFVHAGPVFDAPLAVQRGERVERDGFVCCEILPARTTAAS
jgi:diphthamide synthase (EF-2-diphthine--ammonia ligase)